MEIWTLPFVLPLIILGSMGIYQQRATSASGRRVRVDCFILIPEFPQQIVNSLYRQTGLGVFQGWHIQQIIFSLGSMPILTAATRRLWMPVLILKYESFPIYCSLDMTAVWLSVAV